MKEKKKLIDELGRYFESSQNLSPLAARIKSLLILCPIGGYTFDEIVSFFQSSKSSISANLNLLLEIESIEYFTKPGDRKRYFRSKQDYLHNTLKRFYQYSSDELAIVKKIHAYNKKFNPIRFRKSKKYGEIYMEVLEKSLANLKEALAKMQKIEKY